MIEPCFAGNTTEASSLNEYFPTESVNTLPPLLLCNRGTRDNFNDFIYKRNEYFRHNVNGIEGCDEPFNMSNYGNLQEEYSKNIDIDSELKGINYVSDKCYNNQRKVKLSTNLSESRLKCHQKILEKDYQSYEERRYGGHIINNGDLDSVCIPESEIEMPQVCPYARPEQNLNAPVYYNFNNEDYVRNYPCQKLFNNMTSRRMIPTWHNRTDINPECL